MKLSLAYHELEALITEAVNIKLNIQYINEKTLCVNYSPGRIIPSVSVELRVNAVRRDVISIMYECNDAVSMIIKGVLKHMHTDVPCGVVVDGESNLITIYPLYIKQLEGVTRYFAITNLTFGEEGIDVEVVVNGSDVDWRSNEHCHFTPVVE
ncbi:MAG: hypothetical protein IKM35_03980 [Bacteroidaceae bacterium]|nr:hypothetical protein [Bacteroidaceae bacterium]